MKMVLLALLAFAAPAVARAGEDGANPLAKVLDLMDSLTAKVTAEGEAEAKAYKEYVEWCDDVSKNTGFTIKDLTMKQGKLESSIGQLTADIDVAVSKIGDLAAAISSSESELKSATEIRDKEAADFAASEKELMEAIDALERAIRILEKEMAKNPASFAQVDTNNMQAVLQGLGAVLDAAAFPATDRKKLLALAQSQSKDESDDLELGAPAAAGYKSHSTNILDVLEDMKEKAEGQLSDIRKAESSTRHNYEMLKQSLEDQISADSKDMSEEKSAKASASESKATAEGDLEITIKALAQAKEELATAQSTCMQVAQDHDATVAARTEELKVIAEAKKILQETSEGAVSQTYSLLQVVTSLHTRADLAGAEVVTSVKRLAKQTHSAALAQLASRISAVMKYGASNGEDVFSKVKGLISDMIAKLEAEAESEATEKAYCDEEMAKTEAKKSELNSDVAKMTAKIDQAAAKSASLKEEVKTLQEQLAALTKEQAEMDKIRMEQNTDYQQAKEDLTLGLTGVRKALGVLRDYYASAASAAMLQQPAKPEIHSKSSGAGSSIVGILEVVESDFATNLAKEEAEEADAAADYEKITQENKVTKSMKEQDVKYKTQEFKGLDKTIAELTADRENVNTELSAVLEYDSKIKERCIAKPETYEARKARREAEIKGLKEALSILEDETAFVQRRKRGLRMRGSLSM